MHQQKRAYWAYLAFFFIFYWGVITPWFIVAAIIFSFGSAVFMIPRLSAVLCHWQQNTADALLTMFERIMSVEVEWDLSDLEQLREPHESMAELFQRRQFVIIGNHQSTIDIIVDLKAFKLMKLSIVRWAMKRSFVRYVFAFPIWMSAYFVGFPMLKRNDWEHDKKAFLHAARLSEGDGGHAYIYVEGTRFSEKKRKRYRNLLDPKPGGFITTIRARPGADVILLTKAWDKHDFGTKIRDGWKFWGRSLKVRMTYLGRPEAEKEKEWLDARWEELDEHLTQVYATNGC